MEMSVEAKKDEGFNMTELLAGAAEREIKEAFPKSSTPIAPTAQPARRLVPVQSVPGIEDHFIQSNGRLTQDRAKTKEMIEKLERENQADIQAYADLAARINTRLAQLGDLRAHEVRLTMAATLASDRFIKPASSV
jgi:hypothetical protein